MTRAEALRRLQGTWRFTYANGRVYVRDEALLQRIDEVRNDRGKRSEPSLPPREAPIPG